ncbi:MAG: hypothetical protein E7037_08185 [Verrucomicrobia bacterium]|nr:hypothetical protein [Verrucomicrobiota bacterium]
MAATCYGIIKSFGTKEIGDDTLVLSGEMKEAWDIKTWSNGGEIKAAAKTNHRFECSLTLIGEKPSENTIKTYFGADGTVIITDIAESHNNEDAVQYSVSATIYPDISEGAGA